jgi:hypothetical protein
VQRQKRAAADADAKRKAAEAEQQRLKEEVERQTKAAADAEAKLKSTSQKVETPSSPIPHLPNDPQLDQLFRDFFNRRGQGDQQTAKVEQQQRSVVKKALGLELADMSDDLRKRYKIKDTVKGVVITGIDANSSAADKRVAPGDVIKAIAQEAVASADELQAKIDKLKNQGRKSALMLVSAADGELRFLALPLEGR